LVRFGGRSGEGGIRTPGTFYSTSDFESGALNQLCHLSFTRRSAAEGVAKASLSIQVPPKALRKQTCFYLRPTLFSNTVQIKRLSFVQGKHNTKPIVLESFP